MGIGEAVDTIPSILNKCLFVSPHARTWARLNALPHSSNGGGIIVGGVALTRYLMSISFCSNLGQKGLSSNCAKK